VFENIRNDSIACRRVRPRCLHDDLVGRQDDDAATYDAQRIGVDGARSCANNVRHVHTARRRKRSGRPMPVARTRNLVQRN